MSLSYRQENQLHRIAANLRRSDRHLGTMLTIFGRLYTDQDVPAWEQVLPMSSGQDRLHRAAARIVAALVATAVAISVLLSTVAVATTGWATRAPGARGEYTPRPGNGARQGADRDQESGTC